MDDSARELRLYRRLLIFAGAIYLGWWFAVEALLPHTYNPLLGRLVVVAAIWGIGAVSHASAWARSRMSLLWACGMGLVTAHYFYLFYENGGDINWVVGSFIVVSAITLGLFSRASLIAYSVFTTALALAAAIALPTLHHSVFLPGLATVLLQANIGLHSRLALIRDLAASVAERNRSNEALERSNIDLQRFAYVASHDLQTPLRSIGSFAELLESTYGAQLDEQGRDWLRRTSKSAKHLRTLIDDLLEYARVDAEPRAFERVALRGVVDRVLSLLEVAVRESGAQITCGELPEVMGDRSQLVQLVLNLVGNALKYRGTAAPVLHIAAETTGDEWQISVRDNGIGIAPKHHLQVFEIFKRLHDLKAYPGTGIGLAVCRRVVTRHGGKIWVESQAGEGSVFYFTLGKDTVITP